MKSPARHATLVVTHLAVVLGPSHARAMQPDRAAAVQAPTGFEGAAAAAYRIRLSGDLDRAEPPGGDEGPAAELVGRYRFPTGISAGVGVQHAWLDVEAEGDARLVDLFVELGYAFDIDGTPVLPLVGGRLGYAVETRSAPGIEDRSARGLDIGAYAGARFPLSERLAVETAGVLSFVILNRTSGTADRSGETLTLRGGLAYSLP